MLCVAPSHFCLLSCTVPQSGVGRPPQQPYVCCSLEAAAAVLAAHGLLLPPAACQVLKVVDAKKSMTLNFYCTKILPVGLFMALTLHFGNLVYLYLTVAFIQMLKVQLWGWCGLLPAACLSIARSGAVHVQQTRA